MTLGRVQRRATKMIKNMYQMLCGLRLKKTLTLQMEEKGERDVFIIHKIIKVIGKMNRELLFTRLCDD